VCKGIILAAFIIPWLAALVLGFFLYSSHLHVQSLEHTLDSITAPSPTSDSKNTNSSSEDPDASLESTANTADPEDASETAPASESYQNPEATQDTAPNSDTSTTPRSTSSKSSSSASAKSSKPTKKPKVYLTFSGGPTETSAQVLDILKTHKVKATFFVSKTGNEQETELLKRMVAEGHTIGVQSYSRNYQAIYQSSETCSSSFKRMQSFVETATGFVPTIYRFPGGSGNKHASKKVIDGMVKWLKKNDIPYYDWNVSAGNSAKKLLSTKDILANIENGLKGSGTKIVLINDGAGRTDTIKALPVVLDTLTKAGYHFYPITDSTPPIHHER
jgi:peptidoglycan/xylan/chitin deacetylase (PgdA/CDA1 family)